MDRKAIVRVLLVGGDPQQRRSGARPPLASGDFAV
jgi:hypothetical protein